MKGVKTDCEDTSNGKLTWPCNNNFLDMTTELAIILKSIIIKKKRRDLTNRVAFQAVQCCY